MFSFLRGSWPTLGSGTICIRKRTVDVTAFSLQRLGRGEERWRFGVCGSGYDCLQMFGPFFFRTEGEIRSPCPNELRHGHMTT